MPGQTKECEAKIEGAARELREENDDHWKIEVSKIWKSQNIDNAKVHQIIWNYEVASQSYNFKIKTWQKSKTLKNWAIRPQWALTEFWKCTKWKDKQINFKPSASCEKSRIAHNFWRRYGRSSARIEEIDHFWAIGPRLWQNPWNRWRSSRIKQQFEPNFIKRRQESHKSAKSTHIFSWIEQYWSNRPWFEQNLSDRELKPCFFKICHQFSWG